MRHFALRQLCLSLLVLVLSACGGGGSNSSPNSSAANTQTIGVTAAATGVSQTDAQVAAMVYSDTQRTPVGFYSESVPSFNGYVATTHIKTSSINPAAILQYELCTDDYNQALAWSNTANSVSGNNASLTGADITDRYFEFDRLRIGTPNGYLRERIYKCSYLTRSTVDLNASSGAAGILNLRPINATSLKQLSEYLWQFTSYNNFGNVVLSSSGSTNAHSLVMATLTRGSGNACDTISLVEWKHSVDTNTGDLTRSVITLGSFQARESNGNVTLCASN